MVVVVLLLVVWGTRAWAWRACEWMGDIGAIFW